MYRYRGKIPLVLQAASVEIHYSHTLQEVFTDFDPRILDLVITVLFKGTLRCLDAH